MSATDGSRVRRVTNLAADAAYDVAPRYPPDGRRIVFTRYGVVDRGDGSGRGAWSALRGRRRRITHPADQWLGLKAGDADWAPTGARSRSRRSPTASRTTPATSTPSGETDRSSGTSRTTGATWEGESFRYTESSDPVWSPDGRTIMFTNDLVIANPCFDLAGLTTMKPNGKQRAVRSRRAA